MLGLTLLGQLGLHLLYGEETFLYALHFAPLLVVFAACSTLTRMRLVGLVLAGALVISAGVNNAMQFRTATAVLASQGPPRHQVLVQMSQRPTDPWPRGIGHVVLAVPGSQEVDKAYHEPGGNFSPRVGSFGVSLWLTNLEGHLKATSETIPLNEIRQQFIWAEGQRIPGISTETTSYQAVWSIVGQGRWMLDLQAQANVRPMIVIRSVGPAGGPIRSLTWDGRQLLINNRWSVKVDPAPMAVYIGREGAQGWMTEVMSLTQWSDEGGWGYARFKLGDESHWRVVIEDTLAVPPVRLQAHEAHSALALHLPDGQLSASLNAQVAHLMMGLVDQQTRPGDPMNYPLAWLRDGAYAIVALARAGQLEVAKELSAAFAENDFFGGFGPEADEPGLAIWALEEVAVRLNQPDYDRWLVAPCPPEGRVHRRAIVSRPSDSQAD